MKKISLLVILILQFNNIYSQKASMVKDLNTYSPAATEYEITEDNGIAYKNKYYFNTYTYSFYGGVEQSYSNGSYVLCSVDSGKKEVEVVSSNLPYIGTMHTTSTHLYILIQNKYLYISDGSAAGTFDVRNLMQNTNYASKLNAGAVIENIYTVQNKIYITLKISSQLTELYVCDGSIAGSIYLGAVNTSTNKAIYGKSDQYFFVLEANSAIKTYNATTGQITLGPSTFNRYYQIAEIKDTLFYFIAVTTGLPSLYKYNPITNQNQLLSIFVSDFEILSKENDTIFLKARKTFSNNRYDLLYTNVSNNEARRLLENNQVYNVFVKNKTVYALYENQIGNPVRKVGRFNLDTSITFQRIYLPLNTNWPDRLVKLNNKIFIAANNLNGDTVISDLFEYVSGDSAKLFAASQGGNIIQELNLGTKILVQKPKIISGSTLLYYWAFADTNLKTHTELSYVHNGSRVPLYVGNADKIYYIDSLVYISTSNFGFMSFNPSNPFIIRKIGFNARLYRSQNRLYIVSNDKHYEITSDPVETISIISNTGNASSFPEFLYQHDSLMYFSMLDNNDTLSATRYSIYQLNTKNDVLTKKISKRFLSGGVYHDGFYYGQMQDDSTNRMYFAKTNGSPSGTIEIAEVNGDLQDFIATSNKIYFDIINRGFQRTVDLWEYTINSDTLINISAGNGNVRYTDIKRKVLINDYLYTVNAHNGPITRLSISSNTITNLQIPTTIDTIKYIYGEGTTLQLIGEDHFYSYAYGQTNPLLVGSIITIPAQFVSKYVKHGNTLFFTTNLNKLYKNDGAGTNTLLYSSTKPITELHSFLNTVYFVGTDNTFGTELWSTDGSINNTKIIKDINEGYSSSNPSNFYLLNNKIYFSASSAEYGREMYEYRPTESKFNIIYDFNKGPASSNPRIISKVNNKLYTTCYTKSGFELWKFEPSRVDFTITPMENCTNNSVLFEPQLNNPLDSITLCFWYYGNGKTSDAFFINELVNPNDTLSINLIVRNKLGNRDTLHYNYIGKNKLSANFEINDSLQCLDFNQFNFNIDTSIHRYKTIEWDLGDSTFLFNTGIITHSYSKAGRYNVKLVVTDLNGICKDTLVKTIYVSINELDSIIGADTLKPNVIYKFYTSDYPNFTYKWNVDQSIANIVGNDDSSHVSIKFNKDDVQTFIRLISTDTLGCMEEIIDSVYIEKAIGINYRLNSNIKVYPIPSNEFIHIDTDDTIEELRIIDVLGRVLYQHVGSTNKISLVNFAKGMYTLEVKSSNKPHRISIIKN